MSSESRWTRPAALVAVIGLAVAIYVIGIRGLLFGHLYEQGMMGWYSELIDGFNRMTGSSHAEGEHPLDEYRQRADIFLVQVALLVAAVLSVRFAIATRERRLLLVVNLLLLGLALVAAELILRTDNLQRAIGGLKYIEIDRAISRAHVKQQNSLGFTDRERTTKRAGEVYRIAILGDSFVWGDGLADLSAVWSHLIERRLIETFGNRVEVMSWGKRGWSTYSQLNFLKGDGKEFDIDLLIIGYVSNDPHIPGKSMPRRMFVWDKVAQRAVPFVKNVMHLVATTSNNLLYSLPYFHNWGYDAWKRELYSEDNMRRYEQVLASLQRLLEERQVEYLFVITPTMQDPNYTTQFESLLERFERLGIPWLDLRPVLVSRYGDYSPSRVRRELWANPANGHPSEALHEMYAQETLRYLMSTDMPETISRLSGSGTERSDANDGTKQ